MELAHAAQTGQGQQLVEIDVQPTVAAMRSFGRMGNASDVSHQVSQTPRGERAQRKRAPSLTRYSMPKATASVVRHSQEGSPMGSVGRTRV